MFYSTGTPRPCTHTANNVQRCLSLNDMLIYIYISPAYREWDLGLIKHCHFPETSCHYYSTCRSIGSLQLWHTMLDFHLSTLTLSGLLLYRSMLKVSIMSLIRQCRQYREVLLIRRHGFDPEKVSNFNDELTCH